MQKYLQELNDSQRAAVEFIDGASLVIAGAGSGKTRVLTYKIVHLLKNGMKPSAILALTFTNKAAKEMKERIDKTIGSQWTNYLWMGTFHSIFAKILRREAKAIGFPSSFTIYDTIDSRSLIRKIIKDLNLDPVKQYPVNQIHGRISKAKNNLMLPDAYANNNYLVKQDFHLKRPETARIYRMYVNRCKRADAMDFDDLLLFTNLLFKNNPGVLDKYRNHFKYILVDEYQDTNFAQYLIVKKLSELRKRITVVGDDAQSIYAFRGAKIENIFNFKKDFPEHKLFKLERNYRSTSNIVEAANSIIAKNKQQIKKNVYSKKEAGAKIQIVEVKTDKNEADFVANTINKIKLEQEHEFIDFAILYRTNAQSRIFEEKLRRKNIPYKIYGGLSFYQRKEIKDLLAYMRLTINHNDDESLKRILNYPRRGIGKTTEEKVYKYAETSQIPIWEAIKKVNSVPMGLNSRAVNQIFGFVNLIEDFTSKLPYKNAFELTDEILQNSGILKDLKKDKSPENISKFENIQELINAINDFVMQNEEDEKIPTLNEFLEDVALLTNHDNEKEEDKNRVSLMTIHSAKGLEFKNVFIVGVEKDLLPSFMSSQSQKDLEEERRLFYVAITRAEVNLMISHVQMRFRWGKLNFAEPSRFISEINPNFIEYNYGQEELNLDNTDFFVNSKKNNTFAKPKNSFSFNNFAKENKNLKTFTRKKPTETIVENEKSFDENTGLEVNMKVSHQRFGIGQVIKLSGEFPNTKATIDFEKVGQKQLLLKFAKLKIITF